jgi:WhiB family transcriptional regulator, redox-sensing transcriptional regulator
MIHTVDESTSPLFVELPSLISPDTDKSWRQKSLCADKTDIFFSGRRVSEAKLVCSQCPVSAECLDFADRNDIRDGVWGGLTYKERKTQ